MVGLASRRRKNAQHFEVTAAPELRVMLMTGIISCWRTLPPSALGMEFWGGGYCLNRRLYDNLAPRERAHSPRWRWVTLTLEDIVEATAFAGGLGRWFLRSF